MQPFTVRISPVSGRQPGRPHRGPIVVRSLRFLLALVACAALHVAASPAATADDKAKPADKPADTTKPDAKPGDAKPGDAKPSDAKPSDAKPSDAKPGDAKPGDAKPGDAKPSDAKPDATPLGTQPNAAPAGGKPSGNASRAAGGKVKVDYVVAVVNDAIILNSEL